MPGLITHHYILSNALARFPSTVPALQRIHNSQQRVLKWAKDADGYRKYPTEADCLAASFAWMGSCGPDMFYLEHGQKGAFIADLMHYNKSGMYPIFLLRQVKQHINKVNSDLRNDLLYLLAYAMGHVSHIAADITIHPYVNSIVAAYADNPPDVFRDNNRTLAPAIWKFHNVLEHYQDAYVLYRLFYGRQKFQRVWEAVNVPAGAASFMQRPENQARWFLTRNAKTFYRFTIGLDSDTGFERDKYRFFTSNNWIIDVNSYYKSTIPTQATMNACPRLVQGGTFKADGGYQQPGLFDHYLQRAINQTRVFWREVEAYLSAPQDKFDDPDFSIEKRHFKTLRRHWNLDCGLAPVAAAKSTSWPLPKVDNTRMYLAGQLSFVPAIRDRISDLATAPRGAPSPGIGGEGTADPCR